MDGEESLAEHYRKRAAKTREIFKSAALPALLEHLESVAREYEELADRFEAESSGKSKTE